MTYHILQFAMCYASLMARSYAKALKHRETLVSVATLAQVTSAQAVRQSAEVPGVLCTSAVPNLNVWPLPNPLVIGRLSGHPLHSRAVSGAAGKHFLLVVMGSIGDGKGLVNLGSWS